MNVKNTVTSSDRYLRYAEGMVEDGRFPSVEKVIDAGIDSLMRADEVPAGPDDPLFVMKDEIRRRMEIARDQFLMWDGKAITGRIKAKLKSEEMDL